MDLWHVLFVALANVRTLPVLELNLSLDRLEKRERERERERTYKVAIQCKCHEHRSCKKLNNINTSTILLTYVWGYATLTNVFHIINRLCQKKLYNLVLNI